MYQRSRFRKLVVLSALTIGAFSLCRGALAQYRPISPTMADRTVTLTGHDLTIDQVVEIARYGAKVRLSPEAKQRNADTWGLMMEGSTEGISIYLFNRGGGSQREVVQFTGDPLSPANQAYFQRRGAIGILPPYQPPAVPGPAPQEGAYDSEIQNEDVVRAIMVVRANQMTYLPNSPAVLQALIDLLNADITPVVRQRGGVGEATGPAAREIDTVIRGGGEAYLRGVRMSAVSALGHAGLAPTPFMPGDSTTETVNADVTGMSALVVHDAQRLLDWADLVYAIDLNGMNSSITPLTSVVQSMRPFSWLNWDAQRIREMIRGSYLFSDDAKRIIQDPESLRASSIRQGSAWKAWAALQDDVTTQMNYSEHNPVVKVDASPKDSWELATPQAMKYYVKGGPESHGKHGFIFSNANWDPYPLSNDLEAFSVALANLDVAVLLRQERFSSTFFTVVSAEQVLGRPAPGFGGGQTGWDIHEVWQRIQGLIGPVPPEGYSEDPQGVEELNAETLIKVGRATQVIRESWLLLASDLVVGTRWMDVRATQDPSRKFGAAPTAVWRALRSAAPLQAPPRTTAMTALAFMTAQPASSFFAAGPPMPKRP